MPRQLVGWNSLTDARPEAVPWPPTLSQALYLMPIIQTSYLNLHSKITSRIEKRWEKMARRSSALL